MNLSIYPKELTLDKEFTPQKRAILIKKQVKITRRYKNNALYEFHFSDDVMK